MVEMVGLLHVGYLVGPAGLYPVAQNVGLNGTVFVILQSKALYIGSRQGQEENVGISLILPLFITSDVAYWSQNMGICRGGDR